jgi:hypothetical protein
MYLFHGMVDRANDRDRKVAMMLLEKYKTKGQLDKYDCKAEGTPLIERPMASTDMICRHHRFKETCDTNKEA